MKLYQAVKNKEDKVVGFMSGKDAEEIKAKAKAQDLTPYGMMLEREGTAGYNIRFKTSRRKIR